MTAAAARRLAAATHARPLLLSRHACAAARRLAHAPPASRRAHTRTRDARTRTRVWASSPPHARLLSVLP
jgi:hypothetical protein